jgi:hypothetical protein
LLQVQLLNPLKRIFRVPKVTLARACLALAIAVGADGLQMLTSFLGWVGPDQLIDVVAMILTCWLLGFHILLLPTFVVELIPVLDDLPTWTACTIAVLIIRRREQRALPPLPPQSLPPPPPLPPASTSEGGL